MPKSLVIVESPTKARTISRFLDSDDYIVESSIGHIRDLPDSAKEIPAELKKEKWTRLGINVEDDFKPLYLVPSEKKKHVSKLKSLLKDVDQLYLATDEDREGESISWHLLEVLKPKVPTHRLVFHEITKTAIQHALEQPRDIDTRLVTAQETRRVLDRLYGYEVSPLLWRKIAPALSAGRVQSVSVRVIVQRERERMAFREATYWDLTGTFQGEQGTPFEAELVSIDGRRMVSGKDFEDTTGKLADSKKNLALLDEVQAMALAERLKDVDWAVSQVEEKPYTTQPPAPFITSTLQQEANRKLRLSSQDAMRVAQALYERGYITYMRTDSTTLSDQALNAARKQITERYGEEYVHDGPRVFTSKVKNAQEAHEAIRPAGETFQLPEELASDLTDTELRMYEMIWKRTIASQMKAARGFRLVLQVEGGNTVFQVNGRRVDFPGYLRAYVEGSDDPEAELGDKEKLLPPLARGDKVAGKKFDPQSHTTQPPYRFSEAALIKELEKQGIGRPSTYASIISTILRRQYVVKKGSALIPTFTAFAVVQLMEQYFSHLVDMDFTARMEDTLDAISRGEQDYLPYLRDFYFGKSDQPGLQTLIQAEIDPRAACTIPLGVGGDGKQINVRIGKFGPYVEREEERASLPAEMAPDELNVEIAEELIRKGAQPDILGTHPETGQTVYLKTGRYGPYVQMGEKDDPPKMKSLLPGQTVEELTLEDALKLLTLPRTLGDDPETQEEITVDLGRYGPYARRGKESRSLSSPEELFTATLADVSALFKIEKGRSRFGPRPIRELGKHPESEEPIQLMSGRFGPYVTDGETNASIPRAINPDQLTLAQAVELIKDRAAKGPPKKRAKKAPAKKPATKKTAAKKAAGAKTTTKKAAAKKPAAKKPAAKKASTKTTAAKKPAAKKATVKKTS